MSDTVSFTLLVARYFSAVIISFVLNCSKLLGNNWILLGLAFKFLVGLMQH